jgi:hypothetical protein
MRWTLPAPPSRPPPVGRSAARHFWLLMIAAAVIGLSVWVDWLVAR